jgi:hypothetical protein
VLWVATKVPWPPRDGGRLLLLRTLEALQEAAVEVVLVAPGPGRARGGEALREALAGCCSLRLVPTAPAKWARALAVSLRQRLPLSAARHCSPRVQKVIAEEVAAGGYATAVAEQVQAVPQLSPAFRAGLPVLLRAQNVESELWRQAGEALPLLGWLLRLEARRLAAWEGAQVARASAAVALSRRDAQALSALAGGAPVHEVPAPFPAVLPPGQPLPGEPAVVLLSSGGWLPNRRGDRWFVRRVWPVVRQRLPKAVLHCFGGELRKEEERLVRHPAPEDSGTAFARGAVLVVPVEIGSGVRMRILEAWARGVPVVSTVAGAAGLEARPGVELMVADEAEEIAARIGELHEQPDVRRRLVEGGREQLRRRHQPQRVAAALAEVLVPQSRPGRDG